MKTRAFTLIELLIVVAIIAILAAIAVPNFLEAQVRAKVSRSRADLRTVATALEAYRTDNTGYPPYGSFTDTQGGPGVIVMQQNIEPQMLEPRWLTSPIAYLSSGEAMLDPFMVHEDDRQLRYYNYSNWDDVRYEDTSFVHNLYGMWRMTGSGPDALRFNNSLDATTATFLVVIYDATNGTISVGDIFRTQKDGQPAKF